jgi:beta-glucosidase
MYSDILQFPKDFAWGTATASYQIEGGCRQGGRGASIWDTFSHTPGKIEDGQTGDIAVDHYHRYSEDIKLMQALGLKHYRMSVAWPRIIPDSSGKVEQRGLDFYDRLIDSFLEADIMPYVTLYHWDLPQWLQDRGGWADRNTVDAFLAYTQTVVRAFSDRINNWMTFNEPWVASYCGNLNGAHAPGLKDIPTALQVAHHMLLAHGKSVPVIRGEAAKAKVGIVQNLAWVEPATSNEEDVQAARRWDGAYNRLFMDPVFKGSYPQDMVAHFATSMPVVHAGDLEAMKAPMDFLGINYYTRRIVAHDSTDAFIQAKQVYRSYVPRAEFEEFEIWPEGLYKVLKRVKEEYTDLPLYISENGTTLRDTISEDGCVHDPHRVTYLHDHFAATHQAITEGCDVRGYFVWSLLDNFEWGFGFSKRFGIVYVDYTDNLRRIPKDSAFFLSQTLRANSIQVHSV